MKVGRYNVFSVECERFALDGGTMFGIIPKTIWQKQITPDESNRIPLAARAMLIVGDGRTILVDTGTGQKLNEKLRKIYNVSGSTITENLSRERNINARDVTDVILTHLHFDHTGGATMFDENGKVVPSFPNATYYLQEEHFEWAKKGHIRERASFMPENYMPIYEAGKLTLVKGSAKLFDGIELITVFGHTIAMQMVKVSDGGTTILHPVDLIPTSEHVLTHYGMAYDIYPMKNIEEKEAFEKQGIEEDWVFFSVHDPKAHAYKIEKAERGVKVSKLLNLNE